MRFGPLEAFLLEIILLMGVYFLSDFLATLLAVIIASLSAGALLISGIAELVERSKVPRSYFAYLAVSILAPVLSLLLMLTLGGGLNWL